MDQTDELKNPGKKGVSSLAFAQEIIETMREPLVVLDPHLRILTANHAFYHTFKVTENTIKGKLIYELGNGQWDIPNLRILLENILLKHIQVHDYEVDYEFPTIGCKTMLLNARHFLEKDMILLAIEDITERKRAEEAYRESEAGKVAFFETSLDAIISMDHQGKVVELNPAAVEMFGYSREEAIGKEMASLIIPPTLREQHRKGLAHYLATGEGPVMDKRIEIVGLRKNHAVFPVELTISRVKKAGPLLFTGTLRDITQQKQTENNMGFLAEASKILASSLDYKTTLANIAELAVPEIADWCSVDIQTETGIEQLAVAHVDPEKVAWAKELNAMNPPDPHAPTGVPHVLRTGESEFYPVIPDAMLVKAAKDEEQLALLRKLHFTSVMIVPLCRGNQAIGAITFVTAESGRHYAKADLAMAEELAHRAALAIENARLYSEAQQAIRLRDDFISIASHELKTPVTSLKMYTQVLQKQLARKGEESLSHSLAKMDAQLNKLTVLIGDLLNISKIQLGALAFHEESFDLNEVVKETVETIKPITKKHTIRIEGSIARNVWGDKDRIGQVMTNLLTNAIKYSPEADTIILRLTSEKDNAVVTVQDFGIGIEKEHQSKIFDRFYRVSDPDEKTFPGLGIGLYITQEIIHRHGGTIMVVSEKGQGSRFGFTLPNK